MARLYMYEKVPKYQFCVCVCVVEHSFEFGSDRGRCCYGLGQPLSNKH